MTESVKFTPDALRSGGRQLEQTVDDFVSKTQSLLAEVSDPAFLGTNDTLGGIASMLYSLVVERVQETVQSVQDEYGTHATKLQGAADVYEQVEADHVAAAQEMVN